MHNNIVLANHGSFYSRILGLKKCYNLFYIIINTNFQNEILNKSIFDLTFEDDRPNLYGLLQNPTAVIHPTQGINIGLFTSPFFIVLLRDVMHK